MRKLYNGTDLSVPDGRRTLLYDFPLLGADSVEEAVTLTADFRSDKNGGKSDNFVAP